MKIEQILSKEDDEQTKKHPKGVMSPSDQGIVGMILGEPIRQREGSKVNAYNAGVEITPEVFTKIQQIFAAYVVPPETIQVFSKAEKALEDDKIATEALFKAIKGQVQASKSIIDSLPTPGTEEDDIKRAKLEQEGVNKVVESEVRYGQLKAEKEQFASRMSKVDNFASTSGDFLEQYSKCPEQITHCHLVQELGMRASEKLGMSKEDIVKQGLSSKFYDLGTFLIPNSILDFTSLSGISADIVRRHTINSFRILTRNGEFIDEYALAGLLHHESFSVPNESSSFRQLIEQFPEIRAQLVKFQQSGKLTKEFWNKGVEMSQLLSICDFIAERMTLKKHKSHISSVEVVLNTISEAYQGRFNPRFFKAVMEVFHEIFPELIERGSVFAVPRELIQSGESEELIHIETMEHYIPGNKLEELGITRLLTARFESGIRGIERRKYREVIASRIGEYTRTGLSLSSILSSRIVHRVPSPESFISNGYAVEQRKRTVSLPKMQRWLTLKELHQVGITRRILEVNKLYELISAQGGICSESIKLLEIKISDDSIDSFKGKSEINSVGKFIFTDEFLERHNIGGPKLVDYEFIVIQTINGRSGHLLIRKKGETPESRKKIDDLKIVDHVQKYLMKLGLIEIDFASHFSIDENRLTCQQGQHWNFDSLTKA